MQDTSSQQDIDHKIAKVAQRFSGEVALAARNLATGEEMRFNADKVYGTASTIKLAVLIEVFHRVRAGTLHLQERVEMHESDIVRGSGVLKELSPGLQPTIGDLATLMVIVSDNTATNMLIDRVGGVDVINQTVQGRYGLSTMVLHNRVDFERIGNEIRRFGESSAADLMRLVALLIRGEVVDPAASRQMLDIMRRQQYLDQVPRYFAYNPYAKELKLVQNFSVAAKTGFFPGTRVDAGAIFLPGDIAIAYCAMAQYGTDVSMAPENQGAIVNGILGRLMLERWWPQGHGTAPVLQTPYLETFAG